MRSEILNARFGLFLLSDVAPNATIADKLTAAVKNRLATHAHITRGPIRKRTTQNNLTERLVLLQQHTLSAPSGFELEAEIPPSFPQLRFGRGTVISDVTTFYSRKS